MPKVLFDADDLWQGKHPEIWNREVRDDLILELKRRLPKLKITLFASPGLCTLSFLERWASYDWVELGVHGWYHASLECQSWRTDQMEHCLDTTEKMGVFKKIFRPPQWAHNPRIFQPLKDRNWIYAGHYDQIETTDFHNKGDKVYFCGSKFIVPSVIDGNIREHGHITEGMPNSIDIMLDTWVENFKDKEFSFITEEVEKIYANKDFSGRPK